MNDKKRSTGASLRFTKMHGLGNDFMVIDGVTQHLQFTEAQIRSLADRHVGVGFDQMLLVEPPNRPDVDFRYRIFNADGSEVEQCGNGARCFARFVRDQRLTNKRVIRVETSGGQIELRVAKDGQIMVDMGVPRLTPAEVPFRADSASDQSTLWTRTVSRLSCPLFPWAIPTACWWSRTWTPPRYPGSGRCWSAIRRSRRGPTSASCRCWTAAISACGYSNVGVGETQACGTGACAAVVAGQLRGLLDQRVEVALLGGTLTIEWPGEGTPVMMEGPATRVFEGQIRMPGQSRRRAVKEYERRSHKQSRGR